MSFHVKANFQNSIIYPLKFVLGFLACPSSIRVGVRQGSFLVEILSYSTNIDDTYFDHPTACIDHVPNSPYGGIDLPPDDFYQVHTLSSRHPPSPGRGNPSRPSFRPQSQNSGPTKPIRRYDGPIFLPPQIYKILSQNAMKALKAYNTEAINRFHQRKVHNTEIVETPQNDLPDPEPPVPENDLPDLPESDLPYFSESCTHGMYII